MKKMFLVMLLLVGGSASASTFTADICDREVDIMKMADGQCVRVYFRQGGENYSGLLISVASAVGKAKVVLDYCGYEYLQIIIVRIRTIYLEERVSCYTLE